jgi:hypothetical protein
LQVPGMKRGIGTAYRRHSVSACLLIGDTVNNGG